MPISQTFCPDTEILVTMGRGIVTDAELETARARAKRIYETTFPRALVFDLAQIADYPRIHPRAVRFFLRIDALAQLNRRRLPLLMTAPHGSLGYSIGRVYEAQAVTSRHVAVELHESGDAVCDRLRDLAGLGLVCPLRRDAPGEGPRPEPCLCARCPLVPAAARDAGRRSAGTAGNSY